VASLVRKKRSPAVVNSPSAEVLEDDVFVQDIGPMDRVVFFAAGLAVSVLSGVAQVTKSIAESARVVHLWVTGSERLLKAARERSRRPKASRR
jgi:hypothetical protein